MPVRPILSLLTSPLPLVVSPLPLGTFISPSLSPLAVSVFLPSLSVLFAPTILLSLPRVPLFSSSAFFLDFSLLASMTLLSPFSLLLFPFLGILPNRHTNRQTMMMIVS